MMRIIVDAFSGVPNPERVTDEVEGAELLRLFVGNRTVVADVDSGYQGLGFRGLVVEALSDEMMEANDLPPIFKIANGASLDEAKGREIAERLIGSMAEKGATADEPTPVIDAAVRDALLEQVEQLPILEPYDSETEAVEAEAPSDVEAVRVCYYEIGTFNPGFWNRPEVIGRNNCYNYASNWRTNTFAQPGRGSGHPITQLSCADVTRAALSDGLHKRYDCFPDSEKPRWLMALVVAPGYDYHWYRKSREGFWGHKPGGTAARNTDNNGRVITNPETCARAPYTDFCGYFYGCKTQRARMR